MSQHHANLNATVVMDHWWAVASMIQIFFPDWRKKKIVAACGLRAVVTNLSRRWGFPANNSPFWNNAWLHFWKIAMEVMLQGLKLWWTLLVWCRIINHLICEHKSRYLQYMVYLMVAPGELLLGIAFVVNKNLTSLNTLVRLICWLEPTYRCVATPGIWFNTRKASSFIKLCLLVSAKKGVKPLYCTFFDLSGVREGNDIFFRPRWPQENGQGFEVFINFKYPKIWDLSIYLSS